VIKQIGHIIKNMGIRYTLYRVRHEFEKKTGILKKRHPINNTLKQFISLSEFRANTPFFVISDRNNIGFDKQPNNDLKQKADRLLNGEFQFFSSEWKVLGNDYDWVTNPDSGYKYDINKHWSEIPDYSPTSGDIKYVWEKSRFSWLLTLIRNDYHNDEDHSDFVFSEIESWIDGNPINRGPNWRCSQEISLRILNWCFALHFYRDSENLTEELWNKLQNVIYWSLHHVYNHIDFSRIAVRNNHAITETLFLTLSNMLFPFIPETEKWSIEGRKWFEEEIDYQIYYDGTFLQFSMNYQRVVIQLLSLGISVAELNGEPFSDNTYNKAYKCLNFLFQCAQDETTHLPNYGANDGAWFFPLSDTDYREFGPQLNALHILLTGEVLINDPAVMEEAKWLGSSENFIINRFPSIEKKMGVMEFPFGGYYLIREPDTFTFIKCGWYKDRPSHADNLHIDIWYKGVNILCDGGSYKYNTEDDLKLYFSGTESHNTVMLGKNDQMLKGPRFIWLNWSEALDATINELENEFVFIGRVNCFTYLGKNIIHQRKIIKTKGKPEWHIKDEIINKPEYLSMRQLWHKPIDYKVLEIFNEDADKTVNDGWRSLYYGSKEKTEQTEISTNNNTINTTIYIK
jgi:hypothetical protein